MAGIGVHVHLRECDTIRAHRLAETGALALDFGSDVTVFLPRGDAAREALLQLAEAHCELDELFAAYGNGVS